MRLRVVSTVTVLGLALVVLPALPASAKNISQAQIKALSSALSHAKKLTFEATYTQVGGGKTETVTISQAPPKSNFSASGASVINTGKKTYYCAANAAESGNSGSGNSGTTGSSGNTGNSGSATTTTSAGGEQCIVERGTNPLLAIEDAFSTTGVGAALNEAKAGLKVSSSTARYAGQPSTCVSAAGGGKGAKYCVTDKGVLAYIGSSSSDHLELTKFSTKPAASLFQLPSGATTVTIPSPGGSTP